MIYSNNFSDFPFFALVLLNKIKVILAVKTANKIFAEGYVERRGTKAMNKNNVCQYL